MLVKNPFVLKEISLNKPFEVLASSTCNLRRLPEI
jgi:hypothetical protein